ncbi:MULTISPECIES: FUSC family protein [unclassified Mesorhizobium]|uniref:FUSC family protein n=1 Tax=unclassified Mesorhizobium TaxID=325217 RepID=UPI00112EF124|nr:MULTISPECIES: FUSC family protein [unclassified Mesorhizobium]MBZ9894568.1 FUSC family protein [Mesorhizobium sp. BR1-1-6]TPM57503.1 FUSC family protein [Mesorhizobium sp. B2-2-4]TPM65694.1 FUSC family protein [Mesorhizobium sp. B2-2-1]TPN38396.1 FUSC family protein [Mesorhizobium sp. B1-1-6]TPN72019.1 FUSC family protein [Mesorhizobium sp. B1-1-3]
MTLPEQMKLRPLGFPLAAWAFAGRTWLAAVLALYVSFWLSIEMPSMAMVTVAIIAEPTRGQALGKAVFRVLATTIGVAASIALTGLFSQSRDLLLIAYAGWIGLCVYAAGMLDGNRAYAAVLSGFTVALVAIQEIDNPGHVFEAGMMRGAAILIAIASVAIVNDLLGSPDRHTKLLGQLADIHRRIADHAKAAILGEPMEPMASAALLAEIAALRPEIATLVFESSNGRARSVAAQNVAAALVAELHAARSLDVLPVIADQTSAKRIAHALDRDEKARQPSPCAWRVKKQADADATVPLAWTLEELLRRDDQVRQNIAALRTDGSPSWRWRGLIYRSHRAAIESGVRAAIWVALASVFLVYAGWPAANTSLALVGTFVGLGAITPNSRATTALALMAAPVGGVLAGLLEFVVLDGVDAFPLLAIGLAPLIIGTALLISSPNRLMSAIGRFTLIYSLVIASPTNPQTYNGQSYLFFFLLACLAPALLLATQFLVPPVPQERRRRWMLTSSREDFAQGPPRGRRHEPEEEMFRDAVRIGQILSTGTNPETIGEVLSHFDQSSILRLCDTKLKALAGGPLAGLVEDVRAAFNKREPRAIRAIAHRLNQATPPNHSITDLRAALMVASYHAEAALGRRAHLSETA